MSSIPRGDSDRQPPNDPQFDYGLVNVFPVLNVHIDAAMQYLTGAELRVLVYFMRHASNPHFTPTPQSFVRGFNDEERAYSGCGIQDERKAWAAFGSLLSLQIIREDYSFGAPELWLDGLKARAAKGSAE